MGQGETCSLLYLVLTLVPPGGAANTVDEDIQGKGVTRRLYETGEILLGELILVRPAPHALVAPLPAPVIVVKSGAGDQLIGAKTPLAAEEPLHAVGAIHHSGAGQELRLAVEAAPGRFGYGKSVIHGVVIPDLLFRAEDIPNLDVHR